MKLAVSLAAVVALTGVAAAEEVAQVPYAHSMASQRGPDNGYFGFSALLGAQRAMRLGGAVELGVRATDSVVFAHLLVAAGDSGLSAEGGSFKQVRAGAEARTCAMRNMFCVFGGVDAGYQDDNPVSREWIIAGEVMSEEAQDLMLVPRIGAELGSTVKFRSTVEVPLYTRLDESETGHGITLMTGLGFAF